MIKFIKLKCPNCYANLEVDKSFRQCFCTYCGTRILIDNSNERTVRVIDEADLAREENRKLEIDLKREKNERNQERKDRILEVIVKLICGILFFALLFYLEEH